MKAREYETSGPRCNRFSIKNCYQSGRKALQEFFRGILDNRCRVGGKVDTHLWTSVTGNPHQIMTICDTNSLDRRKSRVSDAWVIISSRVTPGSAASARGNYFMRHRHALKDNAFADRPGDFHGFPAGTRRYSVSVAGMQVLALVFGGSSSFNPVKSG